MQSQQLIQEGTQPENMFFSSQNKTESCSLTFLSETSFDCVLIRINMWNSMRPRLIPPI